MPPQEKLDPQKLAESLALEFFEEKLGPNNTDPEEMLEYLRDKMVKVPGLKILVDRIKTHFGSTDQTIDDAIALVVEYLKDLNRETSANNEAQDAMKKAMEK
jgi:hypothetical protein